MKKILAYERENLFFIPFDHEIAVPPNIQLYMLRYPLEPYLESYSDIQTWGQQ